MYEYTGDEASVGTVKVSTGFQLWRHCLINTSIINATAEKGFEHETIN
jgi:hypothetical protein